MDNKMLKEISKNSRVGMWLIDYIITDYQYGKLVELMEETQYIIKTSGEACNTIFENRVDDIMGKYRGHNFSESLAKAFMEDGRYEEVFPALYGHLEKYQFYMERRENENI